ncbi:MAG TPA: hypothetical protein VGB96_12465, partial [Archangium sp.]
TTQRWSHHAALDDTVSGEALCYALGDSTDSIYVGTNAGTLYSLPGAETAFWTVYFADPESDLHTASSPVPWYGGCYVSCAAGRCPVNCSNSTAGVKTRSFGPAPIRKVFHF